MTSSYELVDEQVLGVRMSVFADRKKQLRELVDASLAFADRDYLVEGDRRITYREHHAAVARVAAYLASAGVGQGDRVAILGRNSIEWVVTFWATVSLGAIAVGLNAWWTEQELTYAIEDCTPALVVDDMSVITPLLEGPDVAMPEVAVDEDDPAVILYTSGTTGRAKGATHSHRNLLCLVQAQEALIASRLPPGFEMPASRTLTSTPLFHVSGLHSGVVACINTGGTIVWQTGRFDPKKTLDLIQRERCTSWTTVPTMLWRVLHEPTIGEYDTSSLFHIGGGGAAWSPALQSEIKDKLGEQVGWGLGYGLTESSGLATSAGPADLAVNPDTVGRPAATVEVKIGPADEIWIRGPMVMLGYWGNDEATRAVIDDDRWLHTGDLGEIRADGQLYLSTRRTDLILRGAENVYPMEIENCLEGHPDVEEVAVIGIPDEEFGQLVGAVVVPSEGATIDPDSLTAYVKERLAYYKVPTRWFVQSDPLPRNASGKVVRPDVVETVTSALKESG
ncbi:MAG TPA: class I adenylate-forming enzyme family protein [Mycobacteriales bacterium]|nr:class I adenylate-forming enzyme family protein [Mycobacteriales bacterium]